MIEEKTKRSDGNRGWRKRDRGKHVGIGRVRWKDRKKISIKNIKWQKKSRRRIQENRSKRGKEKKRRERKRQTEEKHVCVCARVCKREIHLHLSLMHL